METLGLVSSIIALCQGTASTYKAIQHLRGLPSEFAQVNKSLPLAVATLKLVEEEMEKNPPNDGSQKALRPIVDDCRDQAAKLRDILEKVEKRAASKDKSITELYRTCVLRLGKAHRVEVLMQSILKSINALATHSLFRTATKNQVLELKEAIDKLSKVPSSVPDSEFEGSGTTMNQSIADGGIGYQNHFSGAGQNIHNGTGTQVNTQTAHFNYGVVSTSNGPIFLTTNDKPDRDTERRKLQLEFIRTLCPSTWYRDKKNRNRSPVPQTCQWFADHEYFKQWLYHDSSSMLWVSANPGCGKSVLARHLIDSMLPVEGSRTTCYFFFKDDFEEQQRATTALCCILHQLFTQREDLITEGILYIFEIYKERLVHLFDQLWDILYMATDKADGEVVCVLDAFDECNVNIGERDKFFQSLRAFYQLGSTSKKLVNLKFLVTCRPYDNFGRGLQPLDIEGLPIIHLKGENDKEMAAISREINTFIEYEVRLLRKKRYMRPEEAKILQESLQRVPNRTYLWVYLTLELIGDSLEINKQTIEEATSSLPQTVDEAYERILRRSKDNVKARKLLHIVVAAERPLTLLEMQAAMKVESSHRSYKDLEHRLESDQAFSCYIRDLCGLFINIIDGSIYLLHQTAKEFLSTTDIKKRQREQTDDLIWKGCLQWHESHYILYQICLWHLLFLDPEEPSSLKGSVSIYNAKDAFLSYSAIHWTTHYRHSNLDRKKMRGSLTKICDMQDTIAKTWFTLYCRNKNMAVPKCNTLILAAYFGLDEIVKLELIKEQIDLDQQDRTYGRSALSWASENGHVEVVKLLIDRYKILLWDPTDKKTKIDSQDFTNRTPLSYAAWNGHLEIVRLLIKAGANVEAKDYIKATPLYYAVCMEKQEVVKELLRYSPLINRDSLRRQLLLSSVTEGYGPMVERLLALGEDVNSQSGNGYTLLWLATRAGWLRVVEILLQHGAKVDERGRRGRTPLMEAAWSDRNDIARLLLHYGADITATEVHTHRTSLSIAAAAGSCSVAKTLLKAKATIDCQDGQGYTPLALAIENNHFDTMVILAEAGADIETKVQDDDNALLRACRHGSSRGSRDSRGRVRVVARLLELGANIEATSRDGRTPLLLATEGEYYHTVRTLLEGNPNIEARDSRQRTALWLAIASKDIRTVGLLLHAGARVDVQDDQGVYLQELAKFQGTWKTVERLRNKIEYLHKKATRSALLYTR